MNFSLPIYDIPTRMNGHAAEVFDPVRKQWFVLSPEEYVRQQMLQYLMREVGYPGSLIAVERQIELPMAQAHLPPRFFDICAFDRTGRPLVLIELKAPNVRLSEATVEQLMAYNRALDCPWLVLSNGPTVVCFHRQIDGSWAQVERLPSYIHLSRTATEAPHGRAGF
jgi:hypothetical protein